MRTSPHDPPPRARRWPKPLRITFAILLILIGGLFGFVPFVPGWPLGLAGLVILADYFPAAHRLLNWARRKAGWAAKPPADPDSSAG